MGQPPLIFNKPWLSYADQLVQLVSRGLIVADTKAATTFLTHVNYYRLSGYCLAFEEARHKFQPGDRPRPLSSNARLRLRQGGSDHG